MPTTNIDDILMGTVAPSQPDAPESQYNEPEEIEELEPEETAEQEQEEEVEKESSNEENQHPHEDVEHQSKETETDEYGNQKERMSKGMKERLDRKEKQHQRELEELRAQLRSQNAAPEVQKAAKDFEYNPDDSGDWQQQLATFVKQTVEHMNVEKQQRQNQEREQQAYNEFRQKFQDGMNRFDDFIEVVSDKPLDDAMTSALRGISDPAAFVYAAAKRQPEELERISKLRDPHARYAEMIRLEERMRKNKPVTKAPRPIERTHGDSGLPASKKSKEPTIEDLIAKADAKKLSNIQKRGSARR